MDNRFNKIIENANEQTELSGEALIKKLRLQKGNKISLLKRSISKNSEIKIGGGIEGKLITDVQIGKPIVLEGSNTSPIEEIKEQEGKYFVKTNTSVYELFLDTDQQTELSGDTLIKKLGLESGKEISLLKRSISKDKDSEVKAGSAVTGKLITGVQIGRPIVLEHFNTSPIEEIREDGGKYFVRTNTSVYELFLQANEQRGNLGEILRTIEANLAIQPQSLQTMWEDVKEKFIKAVEIEKKHFIFTRVSYLGDDAEVLALVQDETNPKKWKTRVFRFSNSDYQWKCVPGIRKNGAFMKGDENNPLTHYVQSAKLHKDVYKVINSLPVNVEYSNYKQYLPKKNNKGKDGRLENEFEFKEEYITLKNKNWANYQDWCQKFYKNGYDLFVTSANSFNNFTREGRLYKQLELSQTVPELKAIKDELEKLNTHFNNVSRLENITLKEMKRIGNQEPQLQKFLESYKKNVGLYIEKGFSLFPQSMVPDFSIHNRIDAYFKPGDVSSDKKIGIAVEEYRVQNTDGDILIFAMGCDSKGRVFIDNIYDPRASLSDYGTLKEITQMGHLVYKVEDYPDQVVYGIPDKYIKNGYYSDIHSLWQTLPIVKKYKEELINRGVLRQS